LYDRDFLTSFDICFVFGYAFFMCIHLKTAIWLFLEQDPEFFVKTGWQHVQTDLPNLLIWRQISQIWLFKRQFALYSDNGCSISCKLV